MVKPRREVEQLFRKRLGQVLDDVRLSDHANEPARVVDERDVPVPAGPHQHDRGADGVVEVERVRLGGHE